MSKRLSDSRVEKWEAVAEKPMMALSLIFAVIIVLPFADSISGHARTILEQLDVVIWIIFAIDYFGKLFISNNRRHFIRTHIFELAIVVLPVIRPLRLLRLIPLVGYFLRLSQHRLAGRLLQFATLAAVVIVMTAGVTMYEIERHSSNPNMHSLGDALWWAVVTITTVGYGDVYPTTAAGRILGSLVLVSGVAIVGIVTASIAATFVRSDEEELGQADMKALLKRLDRIEKKIDEIE